ncbi:glycosyltransferase family A protein [Clostridium perfringens]|uniref:glycosyltransferase family 2 protein n=1 Tax=Clostridium perfringens TaxID=1502 RepID=UPI0018E4C388|nr:glycosyltransferase family A protein [Clostridium perfringens]EIF6174296.1 glycosyltransferase family 2 protein [Clostridium perfringens]MBI6047912.1 glycosyltransferase family 2 protein [Clostridium perfringens]MDM0806578.1 glycosyltransferase family A protein [Clostridium perfringens]
MNNLKMSIIIPTMNRPNSLFNTLKFIKKSNYKPNEIIIVDQSNNLEDQKKIKDIIKIIELNIVYIYLKEQSLTKARNIGIQNASNEIIIFMDDDIEFNKYLLEKIDYVMKNKEIAMIGGIDELSSTSKSKLGYLFARKSFFKRKKGHVVKSIFGRYPDNLNDITETEWAMGYFFIVRKSLINKYNLRFDENLISYAYPEDLDFTYSYYKYAYNEGLKCILHPQIYVKHLCSKEFRVTSFKATYMYVINREYLSYKHFKSPISRLLIRWANFWEFIRRLKINDNPMDILKAEYYCFKYRKDIKKGILHYEII